MQPNFVMFERIESLINDLRAFASDPSVISIPFSFASHELGAGVLQLAAGRTPHSLKSHEPSAQDFQAAQQFLACVVFNARNDYFALLCVDRNAPDEALKDNYRRLIALVHPDVNPIGFPVDAASRVNLGYALLSNAQVRACYCESLDRIPAASALAPKEHHTEANSPHVKLKSKSPSSSRRLFAWIKRPKFGFGLLALATMLMLPVIFMLSNMAKDTGSERLISGRERSEKKAKADATASLPVQATSLSRESNVAVLAESDSFATRPVAIRPNAPFKTTAVIGAVIEQANTPKDAQEHGAIRRPTEAAVQLPSTAFASNPRSIINSSAPLPSRLFGQQEPAVAALDGRATRSTMSLMNVPVLVDVVPHSASGIAVITQSAVQAQPLVPTQNPPAVAPRVIDTRSRDSEDALLRFGSAFEQGSIDAVQTLFASAMPGRSLMIADYQRVFSNTRQRNIRFLQLKHTVTGQRVTTVGQALVNTIGTDNKSSTQRVFLEIDVTRVGNDVRIERMSNYALD